MSAYQTLEIDFSARRILAEKLKTRKEPFGFKEGPVLASLCACLGLLSEIGKKDVDRLSLFFGFNTNELKINPWESTSIIVRNDKIGLKLVPKDHSKLKVAHEDFCNILSKDCFDANGEFSQIVIYPTDVAKKYESMGLELVVVPDWVRTAALERQVNYLFANEWELRNNIARTQIQLMLNHQLPFTGTHDIVDHLLGFDLKKYQLTRALLEESAQVFQAIFLEETGGSKPHLLISYLIGVLLDDLAQPRWYGSQKHMQLVRQALRSLEQTTISTESKELIIPQTFHKLVSELRSEQYTSERLHILYLAFLADLIASPRLAINHLAGNACNLHGRCGCLSGLVSKE